MIYESVRYDWGWAWRADRLVGDAPGFIGGDVDQVAWALVPVAGRA